MATGHTMADKVMGLTLNQQNYIETIYSLCLMHDHAHVKAIAQKLSIKMASVTEAMQALASMGLVNYTVRQTITLTPEGGEIARELHKRHQVLAEFYHEILGCPAENANDIACKVEHVIDPEFRERLSEFIRFLKEDLKKADGSNPVMDFSRKFDEKKKVSLTK
ncbi:MAG: metal-dependent transcriptional regulator [Victivallales bacterium]